MAKYPILFGRRELIEGDGFVGSVDLNGRALLLETDDGFWLEGVNPGGFAAGGSTPAAALSAFCEELRIVLFDIASETGTFDEFREEVERFFHETNEAACQEWEEAVREVREGRVSPDWLGRRPADSPLSVEVSRIHQPKAVNNQEGGAAIAA